MKRKSLALLSKVFFDFSVCCFAAAPVATAQASSSPNLIDNEAVSGANETAFATVVNTSRAASATSSTNGFMSTESSASGPGFANLTSAHAGVRFSLVLDGPAGTTLAGSLVTEASGSGRVTSELGNRGSMSLASFHYRFQTAGDTSTGSIQWVSEAGFSTARRVSGSALIGQMSATPIVSIRLDTPVGSTTFSPDNDDWLHWNLPAPQSSVYPIESISLFSDLHAQTIKDIKRAFDLYGLYEGTYEPATTKLAVGVDVAYSFEATAGVQLTIQSGRNSVLIASLTSQSNSTAGGNSEAQAVGLVGGPTALSADMHPLRFEVAADTGGDLSAFRLRIDGTDTYIPIQRVSEVPEASTLVLCALGGIFTYCWGPLGWSSRRKLNLQRKATDLYGRV